MSVELHLLPLSKTEISLYRLVSALITVGYSL